MRRLTATMGLLLLNGCGSCLDDKKVPEAEPAPPTIQTVTTKTGDGGAKRPVLVGDTVDLAGHMKHDAAADGGS